MADRERERAVGRATKERARDERNTLTDEYARASSDAARAASGSTEALSRQEVQQLQPVLGNHAMLALVARLRDPAREHRGAEERAGEETTASRAPASMHRRAVQETPATLQRADDITSSNISETTDTGNKYTQRLVLNKTKARITVQLGVNWVKQGTFATDEAFWAFVRKVKTAAYGYLDNKFKVVCTPKAEGAGPDVIELPIDFIIYDIGSGYTIRAHGGPPGAGSQMTESGGDVYEYDGNSNLEEAITYAHEFGHAILGASDEYANPAVPGRVLTNDHSIMANYYAQGKAEAAFKARHFQHIVTEVAKAFAGYSCGIQSM
jgi:hypothetical protein